MGPSDGARLLVRPRPITGESTFGYLLRLANRNRYNGIKALLDVLGIGSRTAALLGTEGIWRYCQGETEGSSRARGRLTPPSGYLGRVCILCLREGGIFLEDWDRPLSFSCALHGVALRRNCTCGEHITYRRAKLFQCSCGVDYRHLESCPFDEWAIRLRDVLSLEPSTTPEMHNGRIISEGARLSALRAVVRLALAPDGELAPSGMAVGGWLNQCELEATIEIMNDWPGSIDRRLSEKFGALSIDRMAAFLAGVRQVSGAPLATEVDRMAVAVRKRASQARQLQGQVRAPSPDLVSVKQLAEAYGLNYLHFQRLFDRGALSGATVGIDFGRTCQGRWVSGEEINIAREVRFHTLSIAEAASLLCCKKDYVHALVKVGYVRPVSLPRPLPGVRLSVRDVVALVDALQKRVSGRAGDQRTMVRLTRLRAFDKHAVQRGWHALMEKIRNRDVPVYSFGNASRGLANFAVRRIDSYRGGLKRPTGKTGEAGDAATYFRQGS